MNHNKPTIIDVCVCTFKRPQIKDTLKSLSSLVLDDGYSLRVIIADNDETPITKDYIQQHARDLNLNFLYIHAPKRNISIARNACLDNATAPLIAFIDDDEIASSDWLQALLNEHKQSKATAILGPVHAIYENSAPEWMREQDFHSIKPVWVNGEIITGYTSNVLLDRTDNTVKDLRFKIELGQSGGEDSSFFASLHNLGHKISFAPNAVITEDVPKSRAKFNWLAKRRFRMGQTHAMMILESNGASMYVRIKNIITAAAKAGLCFITALLNIARTKHSAFWALRGILHLGVIFKLLGKKDLKQYG